MHKFGIPELGYFVALILLPLLSSPLVLSSTDTVPKNGQCPRLPRFLRPKEYPTCPLTHAPANITELALNFVTSDIFCLMVVWLIFGRVLYWFFVERKRQKREKEAKKNRTSGGFSRSQQLAAIPVAPPPKPYKPPTLEEIVQTIEELNTELGVLEESVQTLTTPSSTASNPASVRTSLSQIHGQLARILEVKIDAIHTAHLSNSTQTENSTESNNTADDANTKNDPSATESSNNDNNTNENNSNSNNSGNIDQQTLARQLKKTLTRRAQQLLDEIELHIKSIDQHNHNNKSASTSQRTETDEEKNLEGGATPLTAQVTEEKSSQQQQQQQKQSKKSKNKK